MQVRDVAEQLRLVIRNELEEAITAIKAGKIAKAVEDIQDAQRKLRRAMADLAALD